MADAADDIATFASRFRTAPKRGDGWTLTPRTAACICAALSIIADQIYDDIEEYGEGFVTPTNRDQWMRLAEFPMITWRQDATWRRQLARAADDLADDLQRGRIPDPRCTGEQVVLNMALDEAQSHVDLARDDQGYWINALPSSRLLVGGRSGFRSPRPG
jgi:hypothetical protein